MPSDASAAAVAFLQVELVPQSVDPKIGVKSTRSKDLLCLPCVLTCRFEAELRDRSKHDSWQRQAVAADLAARAAAVRQRRDEMAATQEAAMQARHQLVLDNLQAGHQLKVFGTVTLLPFRGAVLAMQP